FIPAPISDYIATLCPDESVTINGTVYDILTPDGTEVIDGAAANGCDSIVMIHLDFFEAALFTYSPTLCAEESVQINNTVYDISNPSGIEVLSNASVNSCDSTVFVNINFMEPVQFFIEQEMCPNESIEVNNTIYDFANPSGIEVISGGGQNGCDSTIYVDLEFLEPATGYFVETVCEDQFVEING